MPLALADLPRRILVIGVDLKCPFPEFTGFIYVAFGKPDASDAVIGFRLRWIDLCCLRIILKRKFPIVIFKCFRTLFQVFITQDFHGIDLRVDPLRF